MTHADYHPCSEGCGRDSELPRPCEECDMLLQRRANAINIASPVGPAAEEIRAAAQRHLYRSMDPAPAPAPEGRPC